MVIEYLKGIVVVDVPSLVGRNSLRRYTLCDYGGGGVSGTNSDRRQWWFTLLMVRGIVV